MSGTTAKQAWEGVLERRQEELTILLKKLTRKSKQNNVTSLPLITLEEAVQLKDFVTFEAALQRLCTQFAAKRTSKIVAKYLYPHFDHVRSFTGAISTSTQTEAPAALCWAVILVVIQCGCLFAESLDEIMQQLEDLQKLLPAFQKDMELYSESPALRFELQDIFVDYVDYCIIIVRNLTRPPFVILLRACISSTLRRDLSRMKSKIQGHINSFERSVQRAERERARGAPSNQQNSELIHVASAVSATPTFPIHSVNIGENHDFVGRESELDTLHDKLVKSHSQAKPASCVIHGIGGIGKTQTALKFTYMHRSSFDAVFWVSADPEKETEILRTFGAIGRKLELFDTEDIDRAKVEIILEWLQTTERRWLLVFDNVITWESVWPYWPTSSRASSAIIVTSQKLVTWTDHDIPLEPLDAESGSNLLCHELKLSGIDQHDPRRKLAREISIELGGSPLYLSHATGFMALSGSSLSEYVENIRARSNVLESKSNNVWRYGGAVSATHDRTLKSLSEDATNLLFMLAFMSADDIAEDLLLIKHQYEDLEFLGDKPSYLPLIAELAEGRLVQRETGGDRIYLSTHRATQEAMLQKLNKDPERRKAAFRRVVNLIRENFPPLSKLQIAEAHVWPLIMRVLPHMQSIIIAFERAWPRMEGSLLFAELLADVGGMDLYDRGRISESYKFCKKTEEILDGLNCPMETPLRGDALTVIGLCTDVMSIDKRLEGLQVREKCLKVRQACFDSIPQEKVTQDDRIRLYNSYTDLVCSQQQFNKFDQVEQNCETCFAQYKLWGSENKFPYEYAKYYNHIAYVLLYEGSTEKAIEYAKRGFELVEKATPGAQITVLYKFDWANILFQHGDVENAMKEHHAMLKIRKKECGKENVRTLESRLNLGIIYYFTGDLANAERQIRKTLAMNDRMLWPVENITRAKYYLSRVLQGKDPDDQEAASLEQEAKKSLEQSLQHEGSGSAEAYHGNYPILFDYIVPWECRLVTPRKHQSMTDTATAINGNINRDGGGDAGLA